MDQSNLTCFTIISPYLNKIIKYVGGKNSSFKLCQILLWNLLNLTRGLKCKLRVPIVRLSSKKSYKIFSKVPNLRHTYNISICCCVGRQSNLSLLNIFFQPHSNTFSVLFKHYLMEMALTIDLLCIGKKLKYLLRVLLWISFRFVIMQSF